MAADFSSVTTSTISIETDILRQSDSRRVTTGTPSAALALMRSILEVVLRDHYGARGDNLSLPERINNSRKLLPSSANAEALHSLRRIANAVLHLDNERKEALSKREPVELERQILWLLRVLRDLIEGAPSKADIAATTASNQREPR